MMQTLSFEQAADLFLADRRAQNCSPHTIKYYESRFNVFVRYLKAQGIPLDLALITPTVMRLFLTAETERQSPITAKHGYITLQTFFRFLQADGLIDSNPLATIRRPRVPQKLVQTFSNEQLAALFKTCNASFAGVRDRAIMLLLLDSGLRVSELCGLELEDIRWEDQTLKVMGKGSKERRVPFGLNVRRALQAYLIRRGLLEATNVLFVTTLAEPIGRRRVQELLSVRGVQAKLTGVRCSPHTFRHTCAVLFLRLGGDVFSLQKLLGHSDLTMTRRYAELAQTDVIAKHRLASPGDLAAPQVPQTRTRLR